MTSSKKQSKKDSPKSEAEVHLLQPSAALSRLQPQTIEDSVAGSVAFEQVRYGFALGAIGLLTPPSMVCEILEVQQIYLLPNTAAWFVGLINLRGNLVPVFDIGMLLDVKDHAAAKDKAQTDKNMLIIGSGEQAVALIIEGLPQAVTAERQETDLPPIDDYAKSFVSEAYSFQERIWIDLDLEAYLMSLRSRLAAA